jgi:hypothetical protein
LCFVLQRRVDWNADGMYCLPEDAGSAFRQVCTALQPRTPARTVVPPLKLVRSDLFSGTVGCIAESIVAVLRRDIKTSLSAVSYFLAVIVSTKAALKVLYSRRLFRPYEEGSCNGLYVACKGTLT